MPLVRRVHPASGVTATRAGRRTRGQSLVEFALIMMPLSLLLLGIVQAGFIFNAYVTISNASREGARGASIYVYDRTKTKAQNDTAREAYTRTTVRSAMGLLSTSSPQLADSDITVTYSLPSGVGDSDARRSQHVTVRVRYHLDLLVPLIANILPKDSGGRMPIDGQVTMVIN